MKHVCPDDAQLRQLHAAALSSLSLPTLARLRHARQATLSNQPITRRHNCRRLIAACSALLAILIGMQPWLTEPAGGDRPAVIATDSDELTAQNPDLYVWLGSETSLAME